MKTMITAAVLAAGLGGTAHADAGAKLAFVDGCETGYQVARAQIQGSGFKQELAPAQRAALSARFGELVSRVKVHYGAETLPLELGGRKLNAAPASQSFGRQIYLRSAPRPDDFEQLALIAHELVHVAQYERDRGIGSACGQLYDAEFQYEKSLSERQARAIEREFRASSPRLREKGSIAQR